MATLQSIAFCCSFPRHPMLLSTRISTTSSSSSSSFHTCCFLTAARVWNSRGDRIGKRAQELWGYGGCRGRGGAFVRTALFPSIGKFMNWKRRDGDVLSDENDGREPEKEESGSGSLSGMLPYVVAATAVAALANPSTFSWVSKDYYAPALGGIMLSVGIRLSLDDFALAFNRPLLLSIGFTAQYLLKPLLGMLVARIFRIPPMFYAGFILTCCVSGAQLSSYASFLSRGDVALSILLTSTTTISSVIVTPLLTGFLIGSVVPVDAFAMSKSILQVVLLPITIGIILNTHAKAAVNVIQPIMPFVAMICTSLCIGSPLAINRAQLLSRGGFNLLLPILVFHVLAFTLGYWITKIPILRQEEDVCKAISLCTGMQSSTLAGLLATQFLGSSQAVPAACSVVVMAIIGLYLASFWGSGFRIRDIPLAVTNKTRSDANS